MKIILSLYISFQLKLSQPKSEINDQSFKLKQENDKLHTAGLNIEK